MPFELLSRIVGSLLFLGALLFVDQTLDVGFQRPKCCDERRIALSGVRFKKGTSIRPCT
jgi:hypothetical protein